jgi:hypothetical protein
VAGSPADGAVARAGVFAEARATLYSAVDASPERALLHRPASATDAQRARVDLAGRIARRLKGSDFLDAADGAGAAADGAVGATAEAAGAGTLAAGPDVAELERHQAELVAQVG